MPKFHGIINNQQVSLTGYRVGTLELLYLYIHRLVYDRSKV